MPMVRHKDVTTEQGTSALPNSLKYRRQKSEFRLRQGGSDTPDITRHKKDFPGNKQSPQSRHNRLSQDSPSNLAALQELLGKNWKSRNFKGRKLRYKYRYDSMTLRSSSVIP